MPSLAFKGLTIAVTGRFVRVARLLDEDWLATELVDPAECANELQRRQDRTRVDVLTFRHRIPGQTASYPYYNEGESLAAVRLTSYDSWWDELPQETRKNIRRSDKRGLEIEVKQYDDKLIAELVRLNNLTPLRQGRIYPHFGKSFDQIKHEFGSFLERSEFLCASVDSRIVGVLKLVHRGDVASILNLIIDEEHHDKRPANALIARAVASCTATGKRFLTYGRFNYGNKGRTPLRSFKERSGFREFLTPRYYVPLTVLGKVYVATRLHRGVHGILPGWVIDPAVRIRAVALRKLLGSR